MNTYVTEEEQIEAIKKWWNRFGNVILSILIVVLLSYSGWKYWQQHNYKLNSNASVTYEQMMLALANKDETGIQAQANSLQSNYPKTVYADISSLVLARENVNQGQFKEAQAKLSTVIQTSKIKPIKQLARIRLARIEQSSKQYAAALNTLKPVDEEAYLPLIYELRGDIYADMGKQNKAKRLYAKALKMSPELALKNPLLVMKMNQITS